MEFSFLFHISEFLEIDPPGLCLKSHSMIGVQDQILFLRVMDITSHRSEFSALYNEDVVFSNLHLFPSAQQFHAYVASVYLSGIFFKKKWQQMCTLSSWLFGVLYNTGFIKQ